MIVDLAFWRQTAASRLDQEMKQNFQHLAALYGGLLEDVTGNRSPQEWDKLMSTIRQSYRQQLQLCRVTDLESVVGVGLAEKRRQWNVALSFQLALLSSYLSLELSASDHSLVSGILQKFQPALGEVLRAIANSLGQGKANNALAASLHELETHLGHIRQQNRLRDYPLAAVLEVFNLLEVVKEVGSKTVSALQMKTAQP